MAKKISIDTMLYPDLWFPHFSKFAVMVADGLLISYGPFHADVFAVPNTQKDMTTQRHFVPLLPSCVCQLLCVTYQSNSRSARPAAGFSSPEEHI